MRIEGAFDREHLLVFFGRELHAHAVDLLDAHPVLAGDGAAHGHARLQNIGAKQLAALELVGVVGIKKNQRVQIAVASMEHIEALEAVLDLHLGDRLQYVGQALTRNG